MPAVKAYFDGHVFIPKSPIFAHVNQEAIITLLEPQHSNVSEKEYLLSFAGSISHEDYLEMEEALEETEKVYPNDW
jgi:hypothetical protein